MGINVPHTNYYKKNTPDAMTVGCGRCAPCHQKYCNQWAFRFQIHAQQNPIFYCVTLTYDGKHLPYVKDHETKKVYMTLVRAHAQQFFKTLRNKHTKRWKGNEKQKPKISYLICGEYGDKFKRPHYHAIIFGANTEDILESWSRGSIYFGTNDLIKTINYALKYSLKSRLYKIYMHKSYERPFINVSKGIGENLIVQKQKGNIKCITTRIPELISFNNITVQLPRYYTKKLGIYLDTEQFKEQQYRKQLKLQNYFNDQGKTVIQAQREYHKIELANSNQHYNNEILTNIQFEQIKDY